jgi:hypothetical protein
MVPPESPPPNENFRDIDIITPIETCVNLLKELMESADESIRTALEECIELLRNGDSENGLVLQSKDNNTHVESEIGQSGMDFLSSIDVGRRHRRASLSGAIHEEEPPTIASRLKKVDTKTAHLTGKETKGVRASRASFTSNDSAASSHNHEMPMSPSSRSLVPLDSLKGFDSWNFDIFTFRSRTFPPLHYFVIPPLPRPTLSLYRPVWIVGFRHLNLVFKITWH